MQRLAATPDEIPAGGETSSRLIKANARPTSEATVYYFYLESRSSQVTGWLSHLEVH